MANKEMSILSIEGEDFEIVDDKAREQFKDFQKKNDEELNTESKKIVGAINEINLKYEDILNKKNETVYNEDTEELIINSTSIIYDEDTEELTI